MIKPGSPFILGVNYWPRRKAMYWWGDFDPAEVKEEFTLIRELGLAWVRIFLLREDWQPTASTVSENALLHLETVCDIAADSGLLLDITFFTGHMSGPSWCPGWMLRQDAPLPTGVRQVVNRGRAVQMGYVNPFVDQEVRRASELLLRTVVSRVKDHPAVGLWNLGNEPDLLARPTDARSGREWVRRMNGAIEKINLEKPDTCGLHVESLIDNNGFRVTDVFAEVDLAVMHEYPMNRTGLAAHLTPSSSHFFAL